MMSRVVTNFLLVNNFNKLDQSFYLQEPFICLQQTLGKLLVTNIHGQITAGRIVEVELYMGGVDKASHAYPNKRTKRTSIHFEEGGKVYVFRVHTHTNFNFTIGPKDVSNSILVRAVEPVIGVDLIRQRRKIYENDVTLTNGPGKLCVSLGITMGLYGYNLILGETIFLADDGFIMGEEEIKKLPRVGIDYAEEFVDVPWRYYLKSSRFVSKK